MRYLNGRRTNRIYKYINVYIWCGPILSNSESVYKDKMHSIIFGFESFYWKLTTTIYNTLYIQNSNTTRNTYKQFLQMKRPFKKHIWVTLFNTFLCIFHAFQMNLWQKMQTFWVQIKLWLRISTSGLFSSYFKLFHMHAADLKNKSWTFEKFGRFWKKNTKLL